MSNLLIKLDLFFKKCFYQSIKHYRLIIFITISFFFFCLYQCLNLKQVSSIEDQLDPSMQSTKDIKEERKLFGSNNVIGFFIPEKIHQNNADNICNYQKNFNELIYRNSNLENTNSIFKIRKAKLIGESLSYYRTIENPCETHQFDISPLKNTFYQGILIPNISSDLFYSFTIKPLEVPGTYMHFDFNGLKKLKNDFEEKFGKNILWFGSEIQQFYTIEGMAHSQWINFALIIVIVIMLRIFYGTFLSGLIFISSLFFTNTLIYGGMSFFDHPVDPLSICLFLMLAVSTLADFIFVANHQLNTKSGFVESHLEMITPSFFTSLTTLLGFGSLMISDLQSIRRFGFWAMLGSIIEWVVVFIIIPSFMQKFPKLQNWVNHDKAFNSNRLLKLLTLKPNKKLSIASLSVFLFALFSVFHFRLSQTPTEMFPKNHPFQIMIDYIEGNRGWVSDVRIIFTPDLNEDFKEKVLIEVSKNKIVKKVESISDAIHYVASDFKTDKSFFDFIKFEFLHSPLKDRYQNESKYERAFLYLNSSNTEKINILRKEVTNLCPKSECKLVGQYIGFADFSFQLIKTLFESLFLSLFLVTLIIYFLVIALKKGKIAKLLISSFFGPAIMLCLIYLFDLSINFVTCVVASTLVGLTGDNAIQFIFAAKNVSLENGINQRVTPAFYCALTMALCSLLFVFSYFEPPRNLGILLALGFLFSFIGDVWILKGLDE